MQKIFRFPLRMHVGAPCEPCVKVGERVERGECIGVPSKGLGAKIHSSVSGRVSSVNEEIILIEADDTQKSEFVKIKECDSIVDTVFEAGIVGAGGAGFPTAVKLKANIPDGFIVANCIECEPLLNHNITMLEQNPGLVIKGIRYAMEATKAKKAYIGMKAIHDVAIKSVKKELNGATDIEVKEFPDIYPMGEERALIHGIFGEWLKPDMLPLEAKCVVLNAETLANITRAVEEKKPCIDKDFSIAGKLKSGHETHVLFNVPVGSKISDLIESVGGIDGEYGEIVLGGPYTGKAIELEEAYVTKTSGGAIPTIQIPEFKGNVGLLVCACGASEERLRDLANKMGANVVGALPCKNAVQIKSSLKCKTPGDCPGQAAVVLKLKKIGAERLIISNCCDCSNTVMNCAPKLGLPVYHHTDHIFRTVDHKLTRRLEIK